MKLLTVAAGQTVDIPSHGALPSQVHVFDQASIDALNTALAARRPLLVRGEPGTGKSQLARAAAIALGRPFVAKVVDSRSESRDLLYSYDAVQRLATAQVLGAMAGMDEEAVTERLDERRFVSPGPLWWALGWSSALACDKGDAPPTPDGWSPGGGVVVLIDEIDKADSDVPNGLLEALGGGRFRPPGWETPVAASQDAEPPLVVVTTNEERALPDAFVRRCMVLHLALPDDDDALARHVTERGSRHFPGADPDVLARAAELLVADRRAASHRGLAPPGQAEYLDLLRAVVTSRPGDAAAQRELLDTVGRYAYRKHPDERLV